MKLKLFEEFIEERIDLAELKKQAKLIKRGPDYGNLFVNKSTGEVWWVSSDGDGDKFENHTSMDDIEKMLKVDGVKKVTIEAETSPKDEGFEKIEY